MNLTENVIRIWKKRNQIFEGVRNSVFKREDVEEIAEERMAICKNCPSKLYDETSDGCVVKGTQPCCNKLKGGCGCSLKWKTRALSDDCPKGYWWAVLNETEEKVLKEKIGLSDDKY